jgi:hypothetical protein
MKVKLSATIPVVQYGNIMPEFEVEADSIEDGLAFLEPKLKDFWNRHAEAGKKLPEEGEIIDAFVGGQIRYDEPTHAYTWNGKKYLSGSEYAKQFDKPFDAEAISNKLALKYGVFSQDIRAMWEMNADISKGFGTAIHAAIEMAGRFKDTAYAIGGTAIHKHPIIEEIVNSFYKDNTAQYEHEAVVVDHKAERAGRIDLLAILGDKHCRVEDIKTNGELTDSKIEVYFKQLQFYSEVMEADGWKVEPPIIHHWNGKWKAITNKEKKK